AATLTRNPDPTHSPISNHKHITLKSVVNHFVENGSTVSLCSLDVSKAFDRVNHYALFCKLIDRHVPVNMIMILIDWYSKCLGIVNWNGFYSSTFHLLAGVRQGGCLSPIMFAILMDCVIGAVHESGLGCHIENINFGILMYADDLVLVSASIYHLQLMIDICLAQFTELDLAINVKKSVCVRFGKRFQGTCSPITINGKVVSWSDDVKYLGITFKSGSKLYIDFKQSRTKFFRSFNSIYGKISKANETLIVSLIKSYCIPSLMFGLEAFDLNISQLRSLDSPLFLAFAKLFKTFDKGTINNCMYYLNVLPLSFQYTFRKANFLSKLKIVENALLAKLDKKCGRVILDNIYTDFIVDVRNMCNLRRSIWKKFENLTNV
ncbi:MAG: reverse transcriptase domain-containing protein, partial [Oscillospiraceae bacterium]